MPQIMADFKSADTVGWADEFELGGVAV